MQARQQAADRTRALHLRCQRGRGVLLVVGFGRDQCEAAFAEFAQRIDQLFGRLDDHRFDQLAERGFHRVFPAGFDRQALTDARGAVKALRLQPLAGRALLLPQGCVLQGFQRGQTAARCPLQEA